MEADIAQMRPGAMDAAHEPEDKHGHGETCVVDVLHLGSCAFDGGSHVDIAADPVGHPMEQDPPQVGVLAQVVQDRRYLASGWP